MPIRGAEGNWECWGGVPGAPNSISSMRLRRVIPRNAGETLGMDGLAWVSQIAGKLLTYAELTGKVGETAL
jgi:hypothetical protein